MKYFLYLLPLLLCSFMGDGDATDRIGVKGPLNFNKQEYYLAWTATPSRSYVVQEYLPKGDSIDHFNKMLAIHFFITDMSVTEAVQDKIESLKKMQEKDPVCKYAIMESPDKSEFMVDFIVSVSKDNKVSIVEFNAWRYKRVDMGPGKKGVLVYAYSERSYGDAITAFMTNLKTTRNALLNEMIQAKIPVITWPVG